MSPADLLAFSGGALSGHRLRTSLSLLGVAIGVASVVLLTSLGEGARRYVTGEFSSLGTNLLILFPGKTETTGISPFVAGAPHDLTLADAEAVARRVRAARRVAPLAFGGVTALSEEQARERAGGEVGNRGEEAAQAALEMAAFLQAVRKPAGHGKATKG